MTKLNGLLAACALALAAVAPASAQTLQQAPAQRVQRLPAQRVPAQVATTRPAAEPTNVVVAANRSWQPTQITAHAGGQLSISATGRWAVSNQSPNLARSAVSSTDANGYPDTAGQGGTILPSANIGALIGRIGDGAPFLIGASYNAPASADGVLSLSMNDNSDSFADNSGRLAVAVTAAAAPPPPETTSPPPDDTPTTTAPSDTPTTTAPADGATPTDTTQATTDTTSTGQGGGGNNDLLGAISQVLTPDVIRYGLIGAAVLAGLFLLSRLFRGGGRSSGKREHVTVPRVTARVADNGIASQSLTMRGQ